MSNIDTMRTFLLVADCGSFSEAARKMGVVRATPTRIVKQIETDLGVTLFNRTTQEVSLTAKGALYAAMWKSIIDDIDEAKRTIQDEPIRLEGSLSIAIPSSFEPFILQTIAEISQESPKLKIGVTATDAPIRIPRDGFDLSISLGDTAADLFRIHLCDVRTVLIASPSYVATNKVPTSLNEFESHRLICVGDICERETWMFGRKQRTKVKIEPSISFSSLHAVVSAVGAGLGIARVPWFAALSGINTGRLVTLLDDLEPTPTPLQLVYHPKCQRSVALQALVDKIMKNLPDLQ